MSTNVILIVVGTILFLAGLAKLGGSQSGGFNFRNFGINIGSTSTQRIRNVAPNAAKSTKPDWGGIAIAVIGLVTAAVGLFKG